MTREKAIEILEGLAVPVSAETAFDMAIDALKQPEIIRCKDCKHRRADTVYSYCEKLYRMGVLDIYCYMTSDDDFCSMAERR